MHRLKPRSKTTSPIKTLAKLSQTLSIPVAELQSIEQIPDEEKYTRKELPKTDGSKRIVYSLHYKLRYLQGRINSRIFKELVIFPDFLFGSVPSKNDPKEEDLKRDYVSCAKSHCGAKTILKIDIKDFFDNIHHELVCSVFKDVLHIEDEALDYLSNICCKDGFIVQGALTSSYIATLCLHKDEGGIVHRARKKGLVYTRLVDDITVSSKTSNYDFSQIKNHIENMLAEHDLPINKFKTKVMHCSSQPLKVHGLRVDFNSPRLDSDEVKRIKASLHNLSKLAVKNNTKTSVAYRKEYNRCMGKINKLGRVGHNKYELFMDRIKEIKPLPSVRDIKVAEAAITSLEASYAKGNNDKYWYNRKYNLASYKLGLLNRSIAFRPLVKKFRARLRMVAPI